MRYRRTLTGLAVLGTVLATVLVAPAAVGAQDAEGFNGYVQGGTCAAPDDALHVNLRGGGEHDIEPYRAKGPDGDVVLGYYGSPELPGLGVSVIYTDRRFSLVIVGTDGQRVACGDILRPDADRYTEAGVAAVQLLPVEDSGIRGVAVVQRTQLQRELDAIPARVRVVLATEGSAAPPAQLAEGYDGEFRGGTCAERVGKLRVELRGLSDMDINPYRASRDGGEPVTLAYTGRPGAPGLGLAATYTGVDFSLAVTDPSGATVSCGDVLEPSASEFTEAGLALVQLKPVADSGVSGYALIQRVALQREVDVTPTRVWVVLFAPAATT
jgi:hypothetical protein